MMDAAEIEPESYWLIFLTGSFIFPFNMAFLAIKLRPYIAKIQQKTGCGTFHNPLILFGGDEGDRTPDLSVANTKAMQKRI
jgi:hypothetical protein